MEEHTVAAGDIGEIAEESVYRAQNVENLLTELLQLFLKKFKEMDITK